MDKNLIRQFLEAFAVGDAFGKTTETCSRQSIESRYGRIDRMFKPEESLSHEDLGYGQVTDDTEQNVYLIREYYKRGCVDVYDTAMCLLRWFEETKSYKVIGPSSLNALTTIRDGGDIETAGIHGTTCGGIMRTPAAFLFSTKDNLEENVVKCLKPTHFTAVANEAAMAYAYALQEASKEDSTIGSILEQACLGASVGFSHGSTYRCSGVGPSVSARILFLENQVPLLKDEREFKVLMYDVLGSTMASCDVASSVFGLLLFTKGNVSQTIRLATETGGDTDTIACLAAGLCTLYSKGHNIDRSLVELVEKTNDIDFEELSNLVYCFRKGWDLK